MDKKHDFSLIKVYVLQVLSLFLLAAIVFSCQGPLQDRSIGLDINCSVDSSELIDGKEFVFKDDILSIYHMSLGGYLSSLEARSGKHSMLLTGKKAFGLSTELDGNVGDKYYKISVWRKDKSKKSALVIHGDVIYSLYEAVKEANEVDENGWEKLEIKLHIPPNVSSFKVYTWKIDADSAFFDDLQIQEIGEKEYPSYVDQQKLHLYFSDRKMQKFQEKRRKAFFDGVHFSDGEWMKGVMSDESSVMPIKARLKGDWLDHFIGQKWSFRVKMRDDFTFKRMRVFSLQNPVTRYYIHEYAAHQLFTQEGALTTRYGFVPVYRNGKSLGIYAYEEHFAKQLLEFNLRREGPILKFDENPLWKEHQHLVLTKKWLEVPFFETSRVLAFGMSKTLEKENLKKQFHIAQGLMYQYKERGAPVEELFNTDALAKYWALIDVTNGRHGIVWHNQRMYYNPVLCKLEPIDFDNYTDYYDPNDTALVTALLFSKNTVHPPEFQLIHFLFSSNEMVEKYIDYLERFSDETFIQDFFSNNKTQIDEYEQLIHKEFTDYSYDPSYLFLNASVIRESLDYLKLRYQNGDYDGTPLKSYKKVADTSFIPLFYPFYVNAYYTHAANNQAQVLLENYNGRTLEAIGLADPENRVLHVFEDEITLNPFVYDVKDTLFNTKYFDNATQLVFRIEGSNKVYYSELSLWEKNTSISPYQELTRNFDLASCDLFETRGDSLIIKGKHQIKEKILIPTNKVVVFEAGAEVDMIQQATIISHSPIWMLGTEESPILISSSDSTANAMTVLQADGKSELKHVVFSHLNTLDYKGWTLTGAVNFYESDVLISDCTFEYNHCEDALNIIRSDFHVTRSSFEHIFADAFDSDFCTGLLDYSSFDFVGNDAIDFSTSQIHIENCEITNIQDKGISGGEGSTLWVKNTNIINCNIGAASKDLSRVELLDVTIDHCYYGLVALRKKPEYGPAHLETKKLSLSNCNKKHLIEKNSILLLNGRRIEGIQENVADLFY